MGTDSDGVRAYLGRMEQDSRDLDALRAVLDKHRKHHRTPVRSGPSLMPDIMEEPEHDIEVVRRLADEVRFAKQNEVDRAQLREYELVKDIVAPHVEPGEQMHRAVGRLVVAYAAGRLLESDVAYWKERAAIADSVIKRGLHDTEARDNGILLGLRAAAMLVGDHDSGDEHDATLDALAEKIERMTVEGARSLVAACERQKSKPCPKKDCNLPGDDGHTRVTTPPKIKLRAGQIWRTPNGSERVISPGPAPGTSRYYIGASCVEYDAEYTITDTGGCTLVYDPRGM